MSQEDTATILLFFFLDMVESSDQVNGRYCATFRCDPVLSARGFTIVLVNLGSLHLPPCKVNSEQFS